MADNKGTQPSRSSARRCILIVANCSYPRREKAEVQQLAEFDRRYRS
jgi:hypothetical protein